MSPAPVIAGRQGRIAASLQVRKLGRMTVPGFVAAQDAVVAELGADRSRPPELLVVTHPPTFTYTTPSVPYLLLEPGAAADGRVTLTRVRRGGGTLYVGPGFLGLCPLLRLDEIRALPTVGDYPFFLQECMVSALRGLGLDARGGDPTPQILLGGRKVASIGVGIRGGVSSFGVYLNIDGDLGLVRSVPRCSDSCADPSSLTRELGAAAPTADTIAEHFQIALKDRCD
jgi:lipoyl(octanoyl) transferase